MARSSKGSTKESALLAGLDRPLSPESALTLLDPDVRRMRVEFAAYLRAEQRGFVPGHELEDWLAAEAEIDHAGRLAHLARPIADDRDYLAVKKLLELLVPAASAQVDALRAEALLREVAHYELRGDGGLPAGASALAGSSDAGLDLADYDGPRRRRSDLLLN